MVKKFDRREFLSLGAGAVAAVSLGSFFSACSGSSGSGLSSKPIQRTLHFHLLRDDFLHDGEDYQLHVAGRVYPLLRHTAESFFASGHSAATASHFADDVELPGDRAIHIYVTQRSDRNGSIQRVHGSDTDHGLALSSIHIPPAARGLAGSTAQPASEARFLRDGSEDLSADTIESFSPNDVARAVLFHHKDLMALDADVAKTILDHISAAPGFNDLAEVIYGLGKHGWYTVKTVIGDDNKPYIRSSDGQVQRQYVIQDAVLDAATRALQNSLNAAYSDPALQSIAYTGQLAGKVGDTDSQAVVTVSAPTTRAASVGEGSNTYRVSSTSSQPGLKIDLQRASDPDKVTLEFRNSYLRHLSASIEFLDVDGNVVAPQGWNSLFPLADPATRSRLDTDTLKFLTMITPPSVFFGAGVGESSVSVSFVFPPNATQARVLVGGLGNGGEHNPKVEEIGLALTTTFELGVPAMLLAAAAGYHKEGPKLQKVFTGVGLISAVVKFIFAELWARGDGGFDAGRLLRKAAILIADLIVKKEAQAILNVIIEEESISAAEDAIPFVGWAMNAVSIATTAAQLGQTTVQVLKSPRVMESRLSVTHNVEVTINHDPKDFEFPATATHYDVFLEFSGSDIVRKTESLPATTASDPRVVRFENVPRGGTVKAVTYFYSDTDWLAGRAEKAGIVNLTPAGEDTLAIELTLKENLVPLSKDTLYSHKERLSHAQGKFAWQAGDAPTATQASLNANAAPGSLTSLVGVSVNQTLGKMSYGWQSFRGSVPNCAGSGGNLGYAYRTISLTQDPSSAIKFGNCYAAQPTLVQNALFTDDTGNGANFIVQPSTDGRYAVQQFALDSSAAYSPGGILGVFPERPDKVRALSQNRLVGISRSMHKIFHLQLSSRSMSIDDAPQASLYSGPGFSRQNILTNPELLLAPRSFDIGLDETLIILEVDPQTAGSTGFLRAFAANGLPIGYFGRSSAHSVELQKSDSPITYLDMAIEQKGYIYILAFLGDGSSPNDYVLDLYTPAGAFLSRSSGVAAAQMSLDAWRNVYTLNYETLTSVSGSTEPTVSQWIPSTPDGTELSS